MTLFYTFTNRFILFQIDLGKTSRRGAKREVQRDGEAEMGFT